MHDNAPRSRFFWLGLIGLMCLATLVAYWPSLSGDFLWDDEGHVTAAHLRDGEGLVRIWTEPAATQQYYPLLHSFFWVQYQLWGDEPLGYRCVNLALHVLAAGLLIVLLRQLRVPGSVFAGLLFALHPMGVETVAWISEQKNTLSLVFALAAAYAYIEFCRRRTTPLYLVATAFFAAALLSKTVTASLPAVLLVILAWRPMGQRWIQEVRSLAPWFVLSSLAALVTIWNERTLIGAQGDTFAMPWAERLLVAGRAIWFYLSQLLWPTDFIFVYPRWTLDPHSWLAWLYPVAAAAVTVTLLKVSRWPAGRTVWLLFVGILFPALGFFNVYPFVFSFVADHFAYHASLPIFAGVSSLLIRLTKPFPSWASGALAASLLAWVGLQTHQLSRNYVSGTALYESILRKNPEAWLAHNNLAQILTEKGELSAAETHLRTALQLRSNYPEAENNLGHILRLRARPTEALDHLDQALRLQPRYAQAHHNRGLVLIDLGRMEDATLAMREAVRLRPNDPVFTGNLGLALAQSGKTDEAIPYFARAVELNPTHGEAHLNWAIALFLSKRATESETHFVQSIELAPTDLRARQTFGRVLFSQGRVEEALQHYLSALAHHGSDAELHKDIATAYRQIGQREKAAYHYERYLALKPR